MATGTSTETDHTLHWLTPEAARERLLHGSQRWAVNQMLLSRGGSGQPR